MLIQSLKIALLRQIQVCKENYDAELDQSRAEYAQAHPEDAPEDIKYRPTKLPDIVIQVLWQKLGTPEKVAGWLWMLVCGIPRWLIEAILVRVFISYFDLQEIDGNGDGASIAMALMVFIIVSIIVFLADLYIFLGMIVTYKPIPIYELDDQPEQSDGKTAGTEESEDQSSDNDAVTDSAQSGESAAENARHPKESTPVYFTARSYSQREHVQCAGQPRSRTQATQTPNSDEVSGTDSAIIHPEQDQSATEEDVVSSQPADEVIIQEEQTKKRTVCVRRNSNP